jgi:hypothetical protein
MKSWQCDNSVRFHRHFPRLPASPLTFSTPEFYEKEVGLKLEYYCLRTFVWLIGWFQCLFCFSELEIEFGAFCMLASALQLELYSLALILGLLILMFYEYSTSHYPAKRFVF